MLEMYYAGILKELFKNIDRYILRTVCIFRLVIEQQMH